MHINHIIKDFLKPHLIIVYNPFTNSKTTSILWINKINILPNYNLIRSTTSKNLFCKNKFLHHLNVFLKAKCVNVKTWKIVNKLCQKF
jgi:hypothetical protein